MLQVFNELNGDSWSSISALRECIGDIQEDRDNAIMEEEMASQRGDADTGEVMPCFRKMSVLESCSVSSFFAGVDWYVACGILFSSSVSTLP